MPVIRIGRKTINSIGPVDKPTVFYDETLAGFGLSVRPSGSRSWIVEYRPNGGGRSISKRRMVLGDAETLTPEEARTAARAILARVTGGADPAAERAEGRRAETVAETAEAWLTSHVEPKRSARTAQFYRTGLNRHVLPAIGNMKAKDVLRRDVLRLHSEIARKATRPEKPGKRQPKTRTLGGEVTANRALAGLSAMFTWAGRAGLVPEGHNPARGVERFPEEAKERYLDSDEIGRLGRALELAEGEGLPWADDSKPLSKHARKPANRVEAFGPYPSAAIRLLLLTGARLREILHLEWSHYDRQRGLLFLPHSKNGKKVITLGNAAIALLEALPRVPGGRFVIASTSAGLADEKPRRDINRAWSAIRRHAALEDVRLHDARHSFASVAVSGGASLPEIGRLLGHTQAQTTMRYSHIGATAEKRVADRAGAEIAAALGLAGAEIVSLDERRRA